MRKRKPGSRERLLITFHEDVVIPRFPEPFADEPRDSAKNKRALRRAAGLGIGGAE